MSKKYTNYGVIFIVVILIMFILVLSTKYIGSTDVSDYAGTAKFFAGYYNAKIRSSHSYFYGFMSSPFVKITGNLIGMKIMSFIWLVMIMLSIYLISKKDKRTLLLIVTAPIFWYMAPWINPIQIASLLFLWGYYFIDIYEIINQGRRLENILKQYDKKYHVLNENLYSLIRSLQYFDDAEISEMPRMIRDTGWSEIKKFIAAETIHLAKKYL